MQSLFYSIKGEHYEIFTSLEAALQSKPELIISRRSKGKTVTEFPQRTVESEHFVIDFYNSEGAKIEFETNNWHVIEFDDPLGYHTHLHIKISDPENRVRIFDAWNHQCHYEMVFSNHIESLIKFYHFFNWLVTRKNWKDVDKMFFENRNLLPDEIKHISFSKGKLYRET